MPPAIDNMLSDEDRQFFMDLEKKRAKRERELWGPDTRDSTLGRMLHVFQNKGDIFSNAMSSFKDSVATKLIGQRADVADGTMVRTSLKERLLTGNLYKDASEHNEEKEFVEGLTEGIQSALTEFIENGEDAELQKAALSQLSAISKSSDGMLDAINKMIAFDIAESKRQIRDQTEVEREGRVVDMSGLVPEKGGGLLKTIGPAFAGGLGTGAVVGGGLGAAVASTLGKLGKLGIFGAMAAGLIGGVVTAVTDGFKGIDFAKELGVGKISGIIGAVLGGTEDSMTGIFKNVGKFAGIGAAIGVIGGPVGILAGGIIGAAIGGILGWIGGGTIARWADSIGNFATDISKSLFSFIDSAEATDAKKRIEGHKAELQRLELQKAENREKMDSLAIQLGAAREAGDVQLQRDLRAKISRLWELDSYLTSDIAKSKRLIDAESEKLRAANNKVTKGYIARINTFFGLDGLDLDFINDPIRSAKDLIIETDRQMMATSKAFSDYIARTFTETLKTFDSLFGTETSKTTQKAVTEMKRLFGSLSDVSKQWVAALKDINPVDTVSKFLKEMKQWFSEVFDFKKWFSPIKIDTSSIVDKGTNAIAEAFSMGADMVANAFSEPNKGLVVPQDNRNGAPASHIQRGEEKLQAMEKQKAKAAVAVMNQSQMTVNSNNKTINSLATAPSARPSDTTISTINGAYGIGSMVAP